jgi:hypothetical protein
MLLAIGLGAIWVSYSLRYAITGAAPKESSVALPAASTHLGYVLDLALLVPGYVLAAVLLWRRAAWGYVLGTALLVAGIISQIGYMTALIFQAAAGVAGASWVRPGRTGHLRRLPGRGRAPAQRPQTSAPEQDRSHRKAPARRPVTSMLPTAKPAGCANGAGRIVTVLPRSRPGPQTREVSTHAADQR